MVTLKKTDLETVAAAIAKAAGLAAHAVRMYENENGSITGWVFEQTYTGTFAEVVRWAAREAAKVALCSRPELKDEVHRLETERDDALTQALSERDHNREVADVLSWEIAEHLGIDIGEHSSNNDPWRRAFEALRAAPEARWAAIEAAKVGLQSRPEPETQPEPDATPSGFEP